MKNVTKEQLLSDFKLLGAYFCTVVDGDNIPDGAFPLLRKYEIVDEDDERIYDE